MLLKMVLNNNDNTTMMYWSNRPAETVSRFAYGYSAEINNMLNHGVLAYENDRITVYTAPTENRDCDKYENTARCIEIANELDAITSGCMVRCPECGELVSKPFEEGEDIELDCGCKVDIGDYDDLEPVDMWEYFYDRVYDIKYTVGCDLEYVGARIMIACGGPNVYIDTNTGRVVLYWWGETASAALSSATVDAIDAYFKDEYNTRRGCL